MSESSWRQDRHLVRCEWGAVGAAQVAGEAVVVVDVLSFTTSVSVMVDRGTAVFPAAWRDVGAAELAAEREAALAVGRREVTPAIPGRCRPPRCGWPQLLSAWSYLRPTVLRSQLPLRALCSPPACAMPPP
jgi:hypothetical protein